jgi:hypothetical protein
LDNGVTKGRAFVRRQRSGRARSADAQGSGTQSVAARGFARVFACVMDRPRR